MIFLPTCFKIVTETSSIWLTIDKSSIINFIGTSEVK
jgi:hypothetical protein